jgi:type I restriction enzyme S subunit
VILSPRREVQVAEPLKRRFQVELIDRQLTAVRAVASLADVCDIVTGYVFPESFQGRSAGEIPFYKVGDISEAWKNGKTHLSAASNYIAMEEARALKAALLPACTTVFAKTGPSIALNRRALLSVPALVDNNVMALVPKRAVIDPMYLFYFACTLQLDEISHAAPVAFIKKPIIGRIELPVPSLQEQAEIVEEIGQRLARIDGAVSAFKNFEAKMAEQRIEILKAACAGRLVATEAAVARHAGRSYQSAQELLSKLKAKAPKPARRCRERVFEKEIKPAFVEPKKTALPEGWAWAKLRDLSPNSEEVIQSGPPLRGQDFDKNGVPVLSVGSVMWGEVDETKLQRLPERTARQYTRYRIEPGDLLFTRSGSVGRCAVARDRHAGWLLTDHILRGRVNHKACVPEFIRIAFERASLMSRRNPSGAPGLKRAALSKNFLANLDFPLPPYTEQIRIVAEVQKRMDQLDSMRTSLLSGMESSVALRQDLLQRAFGRNRETQRTDYESIYRALENIEAEQNAPGRHGEIKEVRREFVEV